MTDQWTPRDQPLGAPAAPIDPPTYLDPPTAYQPPVPPTPPSRPRWPWLVGVAALVLVAGTAAYGLGQRHPGTAHAAAAPTAAAASLATINANGLMELDDSSGVLNVGDGSCAGMGGYADIREGAQVVVTDQGGATVALGELAAGVMFGSGPTRTCRFLFTVAVPTGHGFYEISVSHRGGVQYSEAQLRDTIDLSLG